jgi:uncharacterized membrane protein YciS (DUF1049 family)
MDSAKSSMLRRVLAVLVLVLVAAVALRLAVGLVVGLVSAVFGILVVVALVVAVLWARSTLKSARRERAVKRSSAREVTAAEPRRTPASVRQRKQRVSRWRIGQRHVPQAPGYTGRRAVETSRRP